MTLLSLGSIPRRSGSLVPPICPRAARGHALPRHCYGPQSNRAKFCAARTHYPRYLSRFAHPSGLHCYCFAVCLWWLFRYLAYSFLNIKHNACQLTLCQCLALKWKIVPFKNCKVTVNVSGFPYTFRKSLSVNLLNLKTHHLTHQTPLHRRVSLHFCCVDTDNRPRIIPKCSKHPLSMRHQ